MYQPARCRPKKTDITRSRTGCKVCRARKKKCDEKKPVCSTCQRLGKCCEPIENLLDFREVNFSPPSSAVFKVSRSKKRRVEYAKDASPSALSPSPRCCNANTSAHASPSLNFAAGTSLDSCDGEFSPRSLPGDWITTPCPDEASTLHRAYSSLSTLPEATPQSALCSIKDNAINITPILSTFQLKPDQDTLFMNLWDTECIPALHPVFRHFGIQHYLSTVMSNISLAVSACRTSRLLPQKKPTMAPEFPGLSYRPDLQLQTFGQKHYGNALSQVVSWAGTGGGSSDLDSMLPALVLFCIYESAMGNFTAFGLHSKGVSDLMQAHKERIIQTAYGPELVAAWLQARMQNWWRRFHFSRPSFQKNRLPISVQPELEALLESDTNRRVSILLILCESLNLTSMAALKYWEELSDAVHDEDQHAEDGDNTISRHNPGLAACTALLEIQANKSAAWRSQLTSSEISIEPYESPSSPSVMADPLLDIQPLYFESHTSTMNYAYYIAASIIQRAYPFQLNITSSQFYHKEVELWIVLMIRIASGINWDLCVRHNVYTVGFSSLMLICGIRTRILEVGLWIEDWIEKCHRTAFEEGGFPVYQILQALRIVNLERRRGREVCNMCQSVEDRGGSGKYESYHSQTITSFLVYGRVTNTGQFYCEQIPIC